MSLQQDLEELSSVFVLYKLCSNCTADITLEITMSFVSYIVSVGQHTKQTAVNRSFPALQKTPTVFFQDVH